jgi:hypothetical protein
LGENPNSVAKYALVAGVLEQQFLLYLGQQLRGLALDSQGNAWVASQGDGMVYAFRPDGTEIGRFGCSGMVSCGGMNSPWDTAIDGEDNVWVANFGPLQLATPPFVGRLTKLWGVNVPAGHDVGDPISPATGYTGSRTSISTSAEILVATAS